jgi:glycosyltransferase involved in cell wall biosynthesis
MRVGFDVAPLLLDRAGTARYVRGVLGELEHRRGIELRRLSWGGRSRFTAVARDLAWYPVGLPLQARDVDVLHCTTFRAPLKARVPVVVTVHDLAVIRFPELFTTWTRLYSRTFLRTVLRSATRVLAVSEFTKRDVAAVAGVPEDRIDVAYNAADERVFTAAGAASAGDYVLAVGTLEPRKNLRRLIDATGRLGIELRVAGAIGWGGVEVEGPHVRWLGRPSDEELAA